MYNNVNETRASIDDNSILDQEQELIEYAKDLYLNQGLSWKQIKFALKENGIGEIQATELINDLRDEYQQLEEKEKIDRQSEEEEEIFNSSGAYTPMQRADNKIIIGIISAIIGTILFIVGVFSEGSSFLRRWGIFGVLLGVSFVVTGLRHRQIITKRNNSL